VNVLILIGKYSLSVALYFYAGSCTLYNVPTNGLALFAKLIFRHFRRRERRICKANLQVSANDKGRNNQPQIVVIA